MKKNVVRVLLIVIIVLQVGEILGHAAIYGYDLEPFLSDVYRNGIIAVLSFAVLYGLGDKDRHS